MKIIGGRSYQGPFHQAKSSLSFHRTQTKISCFPLTQSYRTFAKRHRTYKKTSRSPTKIGCFFRAPLPYSDENLPVVARKHTVPGRKSSVLVRKSTVAAREFARTQTKARSECIPVVAFHTTSEAWVSKYVIETINLFSLTTTYVAPKAHDTVKPKAHLRGDLQ